MRKVMFCHKEKNWPVENEGWFHVWGTDAAESNDGNITWTIGIVEDEEGKVWRVNVEYIRFIDKL